MCDLDDLKEFGTREAQVTTGAQVQSVQRILDSSLRGRWRRCRLTILKELPITNSVPPEQKSWAYMLHDRAVACAPMFPTVLRELKTAEEDRILLRVGIECIRDDELTSRKFGHHRREMNEGPTVEVRTVHAASRSVPSPHSAFPGERAHPGVVCPCIGRRCLLRGATCGREIKIQLIRNLAPSAGLFMGALHRMPELEMRVSQSIMGPFQPMWFTVAGVLFTISDGANQA